MSKATVLPVVQVGRRPDPNEVFHYFRIGIEKSPYHSLTLTGQFSMSQIAWLQPLSLMGSVFLPATRCNIILSLCG